MERIRNTTCGARTGVASAHADERSKSAGTTRDGAESVFGLGQLFLAC